MWKHTLSNAMSPGRFFPLRTSQTIAALFRILSLDFPSNSSNSILPTKVVLQLLRVPSASANLNVTLLSCFEELNLNGPIHNIFWRFWREKKLSREREKLNSPKNKISTWMSRNKPITLKKKLTMKNL